MKKRWLLGGAAALSITIGAMSPAFANTVQYVETNHGWVDYHSGPSLSSPIVGRLVLGNEAPLVAQANSFWYEISWNGQDVYITTNSNYTHVVSVSTPTPTPVSTPTPSPAPTPAPTSNWQQEANAVIATARTQLGVPYLWGHQDPGVGFDCSNFTAWSFRTALGISFSGSSVYQRYHVGTPVPLNSIRAGDLLFFRTRNNPTGGGHVGIYEGNGMVIQEGGGWGKVTEEPLATTWLGRNLVYARRVIS